METLQQVCPPWRQPWCSRRVVLLSCMLQNAVSGLMQHACGSVVAATTLCTRSLRATRLQVKTIPTQTATHNKIDSVQPPLLSHQMPHLRPRCTIRWYSFLSSCISIYILWCRLCISTPAIHKRFTLLPFCVWVAWSHQINIYKFTSRVLYIKVALVIAHWARVPPHSYGACKSVSEANP